MTMAASPLAGVNFSNTFQSHPVSDADAAARIAATGVRSVKMYNYTQSGFFTDASGYDLGLVPGIPNGDLAALAANEKSTLKKVVDHLAPFDSNVEMVMVGNEPLIDSASTYGPLLAPALENLKPALAAAGITVPLTVPFNSGILGASWPPSAGVFAAGNQDCLKDVCKFLEANQMAFCINIYPYYAHIENPTDVPLEYCLFTKQKPQFTDPATGLEYYNLFDAMYDAVHFALKDLGYGELPIIVGECGWPTAGGLDANDSNAQTFNQNLINHLASGNGTPALPGQTIDVFLFEMYDEDQKSTTPGDFETHWGVCKYDSDKKDYVSKYTLTWS